MTTHAGSAHVEAVIARYNEDVSSLVPLLPFPSIVYNKGSAMSGAIALPNIGREAHTFLHHIVSRYDELADWTLFIQGNPFQHAPDLLDACQSFSERVPGQGIHWLGPCETENRFGWPHEYSFRQLHWGLRLNRYHRLLFGTNRTTYQFHSGAQFCVSRERIHFRPRSFYQSVIELDWSKHRLPWVMERMWPTVFDGVTPGTL